MSNFEHFDIAIRVYPNTAFPKLVWGRGICHDPTFITSANCLVCTEKWSTIKR